MLRRWFALALLGLLLFAGAAKVISVVTSHSPARPVHQPGPLVVVSMPTLTWSEVSPRRTPTLWSLARRGAVAAQTSRTLSAHSCSTQSWLTFSAGVRTVLGRSAWQAPQVLPGDCPEGPLPMQRLDGSADFIFWSSWRQQTLARDEPADIGRLGTVMQATGQCITAAGPYAALGAATEDGVVAHYSSSPDAVDLSACPVTFISLDRPDDGYLSRLLRRLPADATLAVSGMADDAKGATLLALVVAGPGVPHGLLTSPSTQQPGFVQTTDLSALVLARAGDGAPNLPEGRTPVVRPVAGATAPIAHVTGLSRALDLEQPFVPTFFGLFLGSAGVATLVGLVWWWLARRGQAARGEPRTIPAPLRWWFAVIAAMCGAMPMATFLVGMAPWWRAVYPRTTLSLGILGISAAAAALALLGPWRRWVAGPTVFLLVTTLFVIAEDVVHGSRLQFTSLLGLQPVYGGRFFGQGNVGYALYATSALLLAALLAGRLIDAGDRRLAATTVVLIGLAAVVVDGYPSWGADGGGPVAMIPAFAYLALNAAGLSLTWKRVAAIAGSTLVVVGSFAVLDYLRPPRYRTHLGDFVAQLRQTGQPTGLEKIFTLNWQMLTASWLNAGVVLLLVLLMLVLVMPRVVGRPVQPLLQQVTFLGYGLSAVAVCWLLGFLANDSGTGIPPSGLMVVLPVMVLLAACLPGPAGARTGLGQLNGSGSETMETARARAAVIRRR